MNNISTMDLQKVPGLETYPLIILNAMIRLGHREEHKTGRILAYQNDPCARCLLVLTGRVDRMLYLSDDKRLKCGRADSGDWCHRAELLTGAPCLYDSVTREPTLLLSYGPREFKELMKHERFRLDAVTGLSREIIALYRDKNNTPRSRLLSLLREKAVIDGKGNARIPMTQDTMADETGTTRETVNRILKELEKKGLLRTGRGEIHVLNLPGLDEAT